MLVGKKQPHFSIANDLVYYSESLEILAQDLLQPSQEFGNAYHLINAHVLYETDRDPKILRILQAGNLICDGKPLARYLRTRTTHVRGVDLLEKVVRTSRKSDSHFFLGSSPQTLIDLSIVTSNMNPNFTVAGLHSPEFTENFFHLIPEWIEMINESGATIVWVGMGTPKQIYISHEIAKGTHARVIGVGAAFDFLAGNYPQAPTVLQKVYLEWFWRLIKEPRRLFKRYLLGNATFIRLIILDEFRRHNSN
jgi:N-acetylglucosaminyldiphosphoundecaprenol N-acetyl-beta-D-mannosaminyltransferase